LRLGDKIIVIVGLPDAAVKEPRDRNSTVLTNSGFKFHSCRFTINLAPAEVKKERSSFNFAFKVQDSFNPWQNPRENAFSPNYPLTKIRPYGSLFKHEKRRHSQFPLWQLVGHSRRRRWKPQPAPTGAGRRAGQRKTPPSPLSAPSPIKANQGK
jgi:hypothetical protein